VTARSGPGAAAALGPVVAGVSGEGHPLVLLHGLSGSARWWQRNIPALARTYRVIAIDLPGFGGTHRDSRFILEDAVDGVDGVLGDLGIERAHVIGHSMGGLVAAGLAAERPGRVDRLVLVDAGFISLDPGLARRAAGLVAAARWTSPSLLPVVLRDAVRSGPVRMVDASVQLLRADWRAKLGRIEAPTLVVWGEHDTICPPRIGCAMTGRIPDARLVVIAGAAHNPMWERAAEFDRAVLDFLAAG
jgi:pimeloyl-ACP methyl ester carboxylesterase